MMIAYQLEPNLSPAEFREILIASTLSERRPVENAERLALMCQHANLIVTARHEGKLIGVARALSDFAFCTYLSDLAVDQAYQRQGIGVRLIAEAKKAAPLAKLILLAAPAAVNYYPKIGMTRHEHCYLIADVHELKLE